MRLLYFRLNGAKRFENIHGAEVTRVAGADLTRRFAVLSGVLLRQHEVLAGVLTPAFGLWATPFQLKRLEIDAGAAEQLEAIVAAGRELGQAILEEELGSAVALHAGLEVGTLEIEGEDWAPVKWLGRLDDVERLADPSRGHGVIAERDAVLKIIAPPMDMRLQKIVSLKTRSTVAYEALVRGPAGGLWHEADRLFEAAARCGLRAPLELACFGSAVELARRLPPSCRLAINLSPDLYSAPAVSAAADIPGLPQRLILEITEHLPIPSPETIIERARPWRSKGAQLALDDAGCGYLNMDLVRALKPDIVKLCITVTRRLGGGPEVLAAVRRTVDASRAAGAEVLAEGVETAEQARLAADCGCVLAQGFYFDRPRPAGEVLGALAATAADGVTPEGGIYAET